ncbi:hypothetical protein P3X46_033120 [Hevea brasiliensis]|uniref:3-beta hydroxysteroid dehydrogenase/isomerase domain-containing protein n=1 Tax=Hevea brasiliensis TaxID=3981 RepID=A0ABQ9KGP0_HEVBR|nr:hypothetical protein P3X46_033120 [Hevea brasiliensis]
MECCYSFKLPSPYPSLILNLQGSSSPVGSRFSKNSIHPHLLSSPLPKPFLHTFFTLKTYRGSMLAEAGRQGWDFGRFFKTLYFFNGPPSPAKVRNEEKARMMLGSDIDLIVEDITKEDTLVPEYFKGVRKVINAASVIVGPKEGDTPERAKYSQGIKFFEPEIRGDSPEMVEYVGMKNLINAVKGNVGL